MILEKLNQNEGNFAKSLEMLNQFLEVNLEAKDTLRVIMAYENVAEIHDKLNEKDQAINTLKKALILAEKKQSNYDLASLNAELGRLYLTNSKHEAKVYLEKSYQISEKHSFADVQLNVAKLLVNYYKQVNDYQKALSFLEIANELSEQAVN
ncbi:hypothetical protein IF128_02070 [Empedobacter stercoris]|uniref:Tetratricopeptide repeat protein n=1 Tax=Empedobacter stercoris TaxID=1628248 RepID=A0ABX1WL25_9FLAO|nr:hypothetical protein [Empedobacter stercoris]MCA4808547.1 hypothetical protein [Empedobacter stercoris]NOJ75300.1 hypothetical protein [Empedobacter stercoris]QNT13571.1 hypothetical protein HNV03_02140 [Empedobacter stercoris]